MKSKNASILLVFIAMAVMFLMACGGPDLEAQEAVRNACAKPGAASPYDININGQAPGVAMDYTIEVSGQNYRMYGTIDTPDYNREFEVVDFDGVLYGRLDGDEWEISDIFPSGIFISDIYELCPQGAAVSSAARSGSEVIGGVDTTRYTTTQSVKRDPDSERLYKDTHTVWVDSNGQLVKSHLVMEATSGTGSVTGTISGYGEPNVVTAPILP